MDKNFRLAELEGQPDALNAIRHLEERLSEQSGSDIALIAYASEDKNESTNE